MTMSFSGRAASRVLVVTGVGLRGELEDRLVRHAGQSFDRPVPVTVHRYGVLRSAVLFRWCQRAATKKLAVRLRQFTADPPDVFAHSFGAWLVGHALLGEPRLRVGRVVLTGSVLRPDFDWSRLVSRGQVEAVLNHYGRQDNWCRVSELFIPESGPSGYSGFVECAEVFNHAQPRFAHTTFFQAGIIEEAHRSLWRPFLTLQSDELWRLADPASEGSWRPVPWLFQANLLRFLVAFVIAGGAVYAVGLLLKVIRSLGGPVL